MIRLIVLIVLLSKATVSFACMGAVQFKVFPVGISDEKIVTVDFQISRDSREHLDTTSKLSGIDRMLNNIIWHLKSSISIYDKDQKLISTQAFDSSVSIGNSYADTMQIIYSLAFQKIKTDFPQIELLTPKYISFCDFQQKCKLVEIAFDSLLNKSIVIYNKSKYPVEIQRDSFWYGYEEDEFILSNITYYHVSSVRIYKTKSTTLIFLHLCKGDEMEMELITSDPSKVIETEYGMARLSKEHKPKFQFKDISTSVYEEPILHHGYGFDVFIVK